ncbi:MAG TPA: HEAT repeat domain-containing protein [Verrucomicrobiae bacterium]|jgi:hypothetical protein|nr:HEAT repeat domain-containing protein [Verrucomicrobiae bacterium]
MRRPIRILFLCVLAIVVATAGWWALRSRDPMLQGKRGSDWIKGIAYNGDDAQTQQWRELGPDGLKLLARKLDQGRYYRKCYRWLMPRLPGQLNRTLSHQLPNPADAHPTRMCVISLLSRLGKDAKPVEPAISRALKDDDEGVREIAVGSYNSGLLDVIGPREKVARLPAFLRAVQDKNWGIRNNAVLALGSYTNDAPTVIPALVVALHDTEMRVQLVAAEALVHMNIQAAIKANVIPILIQILKFPNDQIAFQAAAVLGEMGKDASSAVPALTESLKSPFALVAQTAGIALKKIDPEAAAAAKEK